MTPWPDVGDWLQVPWLPAVERQLVGDELIAALELERQASAKHSDALKKVLSLGIESEKSITRWKRSKAPK